MSTVSVIVPAYNATAYLGRALASVCGQTGVVEVIVVDNNSTDGTPALVQQLALDFPVPVRLVHEPEQGAAAARNRGLALAAGVWTQFLDADDYLLPGKLARQLDLTADADWVIGTSRRLLLDGSVVVTPPAADPWRGLVHNGGVGDTNANLIRTAVLRRLGGQRTDLPNNEDNDLYFRLLQAGVRTVADPVPGAVYADRPGSRLSTSNRPLYRNARFKAEVNAYLRRHRADYFAAHEGYFNTALLRTLRMVYTHDPAGAAALYDAYFPGRFLSYRWDGRLLPWVAVAYPLLGFGRVEWMRCFVRGGAARG